MNTTSTPSTATVKTTVLDALEQATEGRVDDEGFYRDGAFYLTLADLAAEVQMNVPHTADAVDLARESWAYTIIEALAALDAVDPAVDSETGLIGWRLVGPAGDVAHALLEDFEV